MRALLVAIRRNLIVVNRPNTRKYGKPPCRRPLMDIGHPQRVPRRTVSSLLHPPTSRKLNNVVSPSEPAFNTASSGSWSPFENLYSQRFSILRAMWPAYCHFNLLILRALIKFFYGFPYFGSRCDAHMNELPIPCGPWDVWYKDQQNFYNKILALGILWWCFSLGMLIYTESLFLNWGPPAQPGPPSDMVEECDDSE